MNNKMTHRYIARIILEAKTPLFVGSGESSLLTDALVQKDTYGFPMIPGTSLTGVLRHALEDGTKNNNGISDQWKSFFGYQGERKEGLGSQVRISSAYLILKDGKVADMDNYSELQSEFPYFDNLPSRQHVRITDKGVADKEKHGLFDNEVIYKGCRFIFEIELKGTRADTDQWEALLKNIHSPMFRIGQGTRNGYGSLGVLSCKSKVFDLEVEDDFNAYLNYYPSFNEVNDSLEKCEIVPDSTDLLHYRLTLTPDDFFIFSKGSGDEEVDNMPVTEKIVEYTDDGTLKLSDMDYTLIPASSVKGAIAHRTAFHYNRLKRRFVDELEPKMGMDVVRELFTGSGNKAVNDLFGLGAGFEFGNEAKSEYDRNQSNYEGIGDARRGHVIIDDLFYKDVDNSKIFNHVAIDRFTGGAMDGALFSEKVSRKEELVLDIYVEKNKYMEHVVPALKKALFDIAHGLLPLGGMTTKGHGMFTGTLEKFENEKTKVDCNEEKN